MYACQFESLNLLQNMTFLVLVYFLKNFEQVAINEWNHYGTWTPSEESPRCGYHNIILSPEYAIGFDIFSMAMPLHFRETFPQNSQDGFDILIQEFNFGINYNPVPTNPP